MPHFSPPFVPFVKTCKGDISLGTACRRCNRCLEQLERMKAMKNSPDPQLMKVTGDIKAMSYRNLMKLAGTIAQKTCDHVGEPISNSQMAESLLAACEEINPEKRD